MGSAKGAAEGFRFFLENPEMPHKMPRLWAYSDGNTGRSFRVPEKEDAKEESAAAWRGES